MMHGAVTIITKVMAIIACIIVSPFQNSGSGHGLLQQNQFPLD